METNETNLAVFELSDAPEVDIKSMAFRAPTAVAVIGSDTDLGSYVSESLLLNCQHVVGIEAESRPAEIPIPWRYGFLESPALKAKGVSVALHVDLPGDGPTFLRAWSAVADRFMGGMEFAPISGQVGPYAVHRVFDLSLLSRSASPAQFGRLFSDVEARVSAYLKPGDPLPDLLVALPESCLVGDALGKSLPDGQTVVAAYARRLMAKLHKAMVNGPFRGRRLIFAVVPHCESPRSDLRNPGRRIARQVARFAVGKVPTGKGNAKVLTVDGRFQFRRTKDIAARLIRAMGEDGKGFSLVMFPKEARNRRGVSTRTFHEECLAAAGALLRDDGVAMPRVDCEASIPRDEDRDPVPVANETGVPSYVRDLAMSLVRSEIRLARMENGRRRVVLDFLSTPLRVRESETEEVNAIARTRGKTYGEGFISNLAAWPPLPPSVTGGIPYVGVESTAPPLTYETLRRVAEEFRRAEPIVRGGFAGLTLAEPVRAEERYGFLTTEVVLQRPTDGKSLRLEIMGGKFSLPGVAALLRFLKGE